MTRFARAGGSKASNKKIPEDGTPWTILKGDSTTEQSTRTTCDEPNYNEQNSSTINPGASGKCIISTSDKGNAWSCISDNAEDISVKRNRKLAKRSGDEDFDETSPSKKPLTYLNPLGWRVSDSEKKSIEELKNKLLKDGVNLDIINKKIKVRINKLRKKTIKSKRCYKCQKSGHVLADCPENNASDVCFKCGSTEHKFKACKEKKSTDKFAFAKCFICKEHGHISTSCPDNPSGLYPYGGGCHECGDVTHFSRDCPKLKNETKKQITLPLLSNDVEGLPEDSPKTVCVRKIKTANVVNF